MGRVWFRLCLILGRLLRSGTYSNTRIVHENGVTQVRKQRVSWAPFLIALGGPLMRVLNTGVRVLPQREWEERERLIYQSLRNSAIRLDGDGMLVLPHLAGTTLASLLEDRALERSRRHRAIELAVISLATFHRLGLTHGDAMAENVMVDLEAGVAHWFDFETVHDPTRPMDWRRADDLRALLATCLVRTEPRRLDETTRLILNAYTDESVAPHLAASFASVLRPSLVFHLGQAALSWQHHREIARLLRERSGSG